MVLQALSCERLGSPAAVFGSQMENLTLGPAQERQLNHQDLETTKFVEYWGCPTPNQHIRLRRELHPADHHPELDVLPEGKSAEPPPPSPMSVIERWSTSGS